MNTLGLLVAIGLLLVTKTPPESVGGAVVFSKGSRSATTHFHRQKGAAADTSASFDADGGGADHGKNVKPTFTVVNRNRSLQTCPASFEASLREAPQSLPRRKAGDEAFLDGIRKRSSS
jgi:hypothetical protein